MIEKEKNKTDDFIKEEKERLRREVNKRFEEVKPFIKSLASFYSKKFKKSNEFENDLFNEGYIVLFKAVKLYNKELNIKFSTYFSWWLRHAMITFCIKNIYDLKIPLDVITLYKKITSLQESGTSNKEICDLLNIKTKKLNKTIKIIKTAQMIKDPDPDRLIEKIETRYNIELMIEKKHINDFYLKLFKEKLNDLEFKVITRHFGFIGERKPMNQLLDECSPEGKTFCREWLRQKKETAFVKLRPILTEILNEYKGENRDNQEQDDQDV